MNDTGGGAARWDRFVLGEGGSFLQSWEWGEFQKSLGREIRRLEGEHFRALAIIKRLPLGMTYWYLPRGPVIRRASGERRALEEFCKAGEDAGQSERPHFIRIEPDSENTPVGESQLRSAGFIETDPIQPKETRILDLKKSEEELLRGMEHDTRYAIRTAERRGVAVRLYNVKREKQSAFPIFWELFSSTNERHKLKAYPKDYYEHLLAMEGGVRTTLVTTSVEKTPLNASIIVFFGKKAYYLYSASRDGYGRYNAPTFALWNAIKAAKAQGCETFDLWGISHSEKEWRGVTAFKESFGGTLLRYPGAWEYPVSRARHAAYRLLTTFV